MKNIKLSVVFCCAFMSAFVSFASNWTYDSSSKTISDGEWVLRVSVSGENLTVSGCDSYNGQGGSLDLRKGVDGGKVIVAIGSSAFSNAVGKDNLVSLSVPDTLTTIGSWAFLDCANLVSVTPFLPENVSRLGEQSFKGCKKLQGDLVLSNPNALTIEGEAIRDTLISTLRITSPMNSSLPNHFANNCVALKEVYLPTNVTGIGNWCFMNCTNLTTISPFFPASVKNIGESAFQSCSHLEGDIVLSNPTSLSLGWQAFDGAKSIRSLTITSPCSFSIPGKFAGGCSSLEEVHLPETVTGFGSYAFNGCNKLRVFTPLFPKAVSEIGTGSFSGLPIEGEIELSNPAGLTNFAESSLNGMRNITALKITAPIKVLPFRTAFECGSLATLVLPQNLEEISEQAFNSTILESVTLPPAVTTIKANAFGSSKLKTLWFEGNKPATMSANALDVAWGSAYSDGNACFYVLEGDATWDVKDPVGDIIPVTDADLSFFETKFPDSKKTPYAIWKISGEKRVWILRYKKPTKGFCIFIR